MKRWIVQVYNESLNRWEQSLRADKYYLSYAYAQATADMYERKSTTGLIYRATEAEDRRREDRRKN